MRGLPNHARNRWAGVCYFGGSSGSTNTIQSTTPWSGQQPDLLNIYSQASTLDQNAVPSYYPSDTYVPLTGQQTGLMSNLIGQTSAGGDTALQGANSTLSNTLSPEYTGETGGTFGSANSVLGNELSSSYLNPSNSPAYSTAMSNALATALPAANASFVNGNRSDSGLASAAAASGATNAAAGLAQQQYNTNLGIQNQAATQASSNLLQQQQAQNQASFYAPMVDSAQTNDLTAGINAAGLAQTNEQNQTNADVQAFNYGQMLPWNQLGMYEGSVMGTGMPGSSTTTTQPYFNNTLAEVGSGLGAAASLYSLGSAIPWASIASGLGAL